MPGTTATPRALVVDDAPENRMLVSALLIQQGFDVDQAADGEAAVRAAQQRALDLIVLDIGLPDIDGVEVCRRVRAFSDAHVLMLTAQDTELDKVVGFEAGADDYVTKPFSVAELVGRVKAVLRRAGRGTTRAARRRTARSSARSRSTRSPARSTLDGATLELTRIEFDLLDTLTAEPRVAFSRAQLLERVWGPNWFGDDHLVDVHVSNLRRKLADDPRVAGLRLHRARRRVPDGRRPVTAAPPLDAAARARGGRPRLGPATASSSTPTRRWRGCSASPPSMLIGAPSDAVVLLAPGGDSLPPEQFPAARVARTGGRVDQEFGVPHADGGHRLGRRALGAAARTGTIVVRLHADHRGRGQGARVGARIATLVDDSPDLVWMFDGAGLIEYASPSFSAALGLRQDEVIGRLWRALTHPDRRARPARRARRRRPGRAAHAACSSCACARATAAGAGSRARRRCASAAASAIAVEITGRDVTRTRAAEDEGRRLSSQLEALVAGAPDGIVMARRGRAGSRSSTSRRARCWSSRSAPRSSSAPRSPRCCPACDRLLAEPEAGDRAAARDRRRPASRCASTTSMRGRAPDRLRPRPARGRAGCGCSATSRSSSSMEEEQREFLATMSHEIKTPLSGIAGAAELLIDAGAAARASASWPR